MVEFNFISKKEAEETCAELTKAMYGNIDSPLQWMKTFSEFLKKELKLQQSLSDPCIFYKKNEGKLVLVLVLYVDDTMCAGERKEVNWAYSMIEKRFKIEKLGKLKKHLGIWWEWKLDKKGNKYLVGKMPNMVKEIGDKFEAATGKRAKRYATPGAPGKTLRKNQGPMIDLDNYRSIVGKIMYYATKIAPDVSNAARELATHLSNPGTEHWRALERCVGYLEQQGDQGLTLRAPTELRSISDCDADYAKDENDRRSIKGDDKYHWRYDHKLDFKETTDSITKQY